MLIKRTQRRGVTLFELLAVVTILGFMSAIVLMRYGRTIFGDIGSRSDAQQVAMALRHAQRAAIATGDNHFVQFDNATATNFSLYRRSGSSDTLVDGPNALSTDTVITASATEMGFTFEGQALGSYTVSLTGDNQTWQVSVIPISGAIRVRQTAP